MISAQVDQEEGVDVVVIPTQGPMYYQPLPVGEPQLDAIRKIIGKDLGSPYYHYFLVPGEGEMRWMSLWMLDSFDGQVDNENLTNLGWNASGPTKIQGTVVATFTSNLQSEPITYYQPFPYDSGNVEAILQEHAHARRHDEFPATHDRLMRGDYMVLLKMPGITVPQRGTTTS